MRKNAFNKKNYKRWRFSAVTYDHCMYALDLRSVDAYIPSEERNQEYSTDHIHTDDKAKDVFDKCKEFVSWGNYFFSAEYRSTHHVDKIWEENHGNEHISRVIEGVIHIIEELRDEVHSNKGKQFEDDLNDYLDYTKWHYVRLSNMYYGGPEYWNRERMLMHCNQLCLRTSIFMSFLTSNRDLSNFIDRIISSIHKNNLPYDMNNHDWRMWMSEYGKSKCVAIAKVVRKSAIIEWYMAFSGFWDNDAVSNRFHLRQSADGFLKAWEKAIIHTRFQNISINNIVLCTVNLENESFMIRPIGSLAHKLREYTVSDNRLVCLKKHFSCCERKILSQIYNKKKISSIQFYITFEPCNDCQRAIDYTESLYRKGMIKVSARKAYDGKEHWCK